MNHHTPKIIGYRVARVRPYGPTGDDLEVTPLPGLWDDRDAAEGMAVIQGDGARVIEMRRGGRSSADPTGRPKSNWWLVVCGGGEVELSFTTWQSAARTYDRILRHQECPYEHHVVTRHGDVIALFASENRQRVASRVPAARPGPLHQRKAT
ncbi:hypothetical protein [Nonomuraea aridisoli]|uniref:Uncharacterized protein n=1 Tax=Nonomuraea aridisoli TaxID=2070368 RepID=A0A2W2CX69_9ACTN|nr:hypothetical protein [Nonomuraea aridisoli]PZG04322.1 hypothetical protein C1J01_44785 [Nonomuraea aridisoli]